MNLQLVNSKVSYNPVGSHIVFVTGEHLSFTNVILFLLLCVCNIDINLELLMLSYLYFLQDQLLVKLQWHIFINVM